MDLVLDAILVCLGTWLIFYRCFIRTRCRFWVEIGTQVACGASVVLLSSMATDLPTWAATVLLMLFGMIFGICQATSALCVCISMGSFLGGVIWQLGLKDSLPEYHDVFMASCCFAFSLIFCATPIGPAVFEGMLVPSTGAMMLTAAVIDAIPACGGIELATLLGAEASDSDGGNPLMNLLAFLGVASYSTMMQLLMMRPAGNGGGPGAGMFAKLLPAGGTEGGLIPRPENFEADGRFKRICKAIYADEGDPIFAALTEDERALVDCCRKDEFERDRVIWGGGLL